jgi:hypothetical protein
MHNFHWTPEYWSHLTARQKAVIIAGIDIRVKEEERERKKAESQAKRRH